MYWFISLWSTYQHWLFLYQPWSSLIRLIPMVDPALNYGYPLRLSRLWFSDSPILLWWCGAPPWGPAVSRASEVVCMCFSLFTAAAMAPRHSLVDMDILPRPELLMNWRGDETRRKMTAETSGNIWWFHGFHWFHWFHVVCLVFFQTGEKKHDALLACAPSLKMTWVDLGCFFSCETGWIVAVDSSQLLDLGRIFGWNWLMKEMTKNTHLTVDSWIIAAHSCQRRLGWKVGAVLCLNPSPVACSYQSRLFEDG